MGNVSEASTTPSASGQGSAFRICRTTSPRWTPRSAQSSSAIASASPTMPARIRRPVRTGAASGFVKRERDEVEQLLEQRPDRGQVGTPGELGGQRPADRGGALQGGATAIAERLDRHRVPAGLAAEPEPRARPAPSRARAAAAPACGSSPPALRRSVGGGSGSGARLAMGTTSASAGSAPASNCSDSIGTISASGAATGEPRRCRSARLVEPVGHVENPAGDLHPVARVRHRSQQLARGLEIRDQLAGRAGSPCPPPAPRESSGRTRRALPPPGRARAYSPIAARR